MKKILITKNGDQKKYRSIREAAIDLNVSQRVLTRWINGETTPYFFKNFSFKYVEDDTLTEVKFELDKNGNPKNNIQNIKLYLLTKYNLFCFNELSQTLEINNTLISDEMLADICVKMEEEIGINNEHKTEQAITNLCLENRYNPILEKLDNLEWDGTKRAETFFIDFVGAHDTPLNRYYTRNWLKGAIKRAYEPGCMWDHMLILQDKAGGTGKTKVFERLAVGFYAQDPDVGNKDAINIMNYAWIINLDELARFDSKEMNLLKTFITTRKDTNRLAYAKFAKEFKRHCIFCGTTNDQYFLRDYTGNVERRFWIVNCSGTRKNTKWWKDNLTDYYIDQVWAEVKEWYLADNEIEPMSVDLQNDEIFIQQGHKSFGKDTDFLEQLDAALNAKYSKDALENYNVFKKEVFNADYNFDRIYPIEEISLRKLAGVFKKTEDYIGKAIISLNKDWIIRDGKIVKYNKQKELDFQD